MKPRASRSVRPRSPSLRRRSSCPDARLCRRTIPSELNKANLQRDIIDRRAQLVQAEDTRRRKLEYDVLARQILAVGDRSTLEAEIAQAGEELSRSLKEKGGVKETLGRRKKAFTALMGGLKDVRDMVPPKDEQEEEEEADLGEGTSGKEVTPAAEGTTPTVEGDAEAFGEGKVPVPEDDEEDDPARRTAAVTRQPTPTSTSTDTPSLDAEKPAEPQFISAHKTLDPGHEEDGSELANVEDALALGELTETETVATPAPSVGHPSSEARQPLPVDETKPGSHELSSNSSTILVDIPTKESSSLSDLEMLASATKKEDTPEEDVDEPPSSTAGAKGKGEGRRLTSDTRTSVPTRCSSRSISPVKPSTSTPSSPSKKTRSSGRKSSSPTKEALQEVEDEADEDEPTPASGGRPKRGAAKSTKEPPAKKPRTSGGSKR